MHQFQVWAPSKKSLDVVIEDRAIAMQSCPKSGWWFADVNVDIRDCEYKFRIDCDALLPDPRSLWQPHGVHGTSRLIDHGQFRWTDASFQARPLSSAIIYELHVGTFTSAGTFAAAIDKLDHLVELGVTHVELMPVVEFGGTRGWGYDGAFPYAPHHAYGGPQGLKQLVDAAHAKGLAVLLDVVYNHLGPTGNYLPCFAPYFTERHMTPWGCALNFDGPHSDEVRRYFIDNAKMWLRDYHFDGLRLDAIHAIVDSSAYPFLEQLSAEVKQLEAYLGRHLVLIAESDLNDPRVIQSRERGGFGLDAQWTDDFHHALHTALSGEQQGYYRDFAEPEQLGAICQRPFVYDGQYSSCRGRVHGRQPSGLEAAKFVVCSQNHDQIGNRAHGERLAHLITPDQAKLAAALVLLSPYVPMLFQGEEWNASSPFQFFVDFAEEPELARAVSEGRRREFQEFSLAADIPDPQDPATFIRSKLNWQEQRHAPHREMLNWYRELIALRRRVPDFVDGRLELTQVTQDADAGWLRIERATTTVVFNFADEPTCVELECAAGARMLLASHPGVEFSDGQLVLPAQSMAVVRRPARFQNEPSSKRDQMVELNLDNQMDSTSHEGSSERVCAESIEVASAG